MADVMQFNLDTLDSRNKALDFFGRVRSCVMECYDEMPDFLKHYVDVLSPLELSVMVTSDDVEDADDEADNVWRGMSYELKAGALSLKNVRRDASRLIQGIFDKYGDPTELEYEKEYAILANLLEDLKELDVAVLGNARMKDWVEDLEECCRHFNLMNSIENSITDDEEDQNQAFAEVRQAYGEMMSMIAMMDKDDALNKAIENINALIAEFDA
jgi:hypothetical protein